MTRPTGDRVHPFEQLPGLVSGELGPGEAAAVTDHLLSCDDCRHELVGVSAMTGMLADARRLAPVPAAHLPPLRQPTAVGGRWHRAGRRPRALAVLTAIAVVGLSVGALSVGGVLRRPASTAGPSAEVTVALRPVGAGRISGSAVMSGRQDDQRMTVDVAGLTGRPGGFYEVWLLDPAHQRALAVGVLPDSGHASFSLPASSTVGYTTVDISAEVSDGDPAHSTDSVARGDL